MKTGHVELAEHGWVAVCDDHGTRVGVGTLNEASSAAVTPSSFCPLCEEEEHDE